MNNTQTLLIKAIHADALELTKNNADAVLALWRALRAFVAPLTNAAPETLEDLAAVTQWLALALRKGTGAPDDVTDEELLAAVA